MLENVVQNEIPISNILIQYNDNADRPNLDFSELKPETNIHSQVWALSLIRLKISELILTGCKT